MKSLLLIPALLLSFGMDESSNYQKVSMQPRLGVNTLQAPQHDCPLDTPSHRGLIEHFFTSETYVDVRGTYDIPDEALSSLRVLGTISDAAEEQNDLTDAVACGILNEHYGDEFPSAQNPDPFHHPAYYTAGGFYFVILRIRPHPDPNRFRTGLEYVIIYDSNMNRLMGYTI